MTAAVILKYKASFPAERIPFKTVNLRGRKPYERSEDEMRLVWRSGGYNTYAIWRVTPQVRLYL